MSNSPKVLIWGTGDHTKKVLKKGINAEIVGFIESNAANKYYDGLPVYLPKNIPDNIDVILVANRFGDEIFDLCKTLGIKTEKMVFLLKGENTPFNNIDGLDDILGGWNYTDYIIQYHGISGSFFGNDMELYQKLNKRPAFNIDKEDLWPFIYDKFMPAGSTSNYFLQDLWAAKKIISGGVKKHYDIGSRLDGFIAHLLAAGIEVNMIDIREFPGQFEGLKTICDDATTLHEFENESIESLSALCSLEHFGLGRYGDPIDPEACFKCFNSIQKKMKTGGNLYISVPVGRERVEFNACRIFFVSTILKCFEQMELIECCYAAEGKYEYPQGYHQYDSDNNNGDYRYGLFHFRKR